MNIIFVDIDGPLLPTKAWFAENNREILKTYGRTEWINNPDFDKSVIEFDWGAVGMFNLWSEYSNAKIVISSNWTLHTSKEQLIELFTANGMNLDLHDNWATPANMKRSSRGVEISSWLFYQDQEYENILIVDDDKSIKTCPELEDKYILVDLDHGLTSRDFKKGCEILKIDYPQILEDQFCIENLTSEEREIRQKELDKALSLFL